jgi:bacteriocin-like protein
MSIKYLTDKSLASVTGGVGGPKSNGIAGLDAFIDATGVVPDQRLSNSQGTAALKELPFPDVLVTNAANFPH